MHLKQTHATHMPNIGGVESRYQQKAEEYIASQRMKNQSVLMKHKRGYSTNDNEQTRHASVNFLRRKAREAELISGRNMRSGGRRSPEQF